MLVFHKRRKEVPCTLFRYEIEMRKSLDLQEYTKQVYVVDATSSEEAEHILRTNLHGEGNMSAQPTRMKILGGVIPKLFEAE